MKIVSPQFSLQIILIILTITSCTKNQKPQDTSPYYECERKKPKIPEKYNQYLDRKENEFNELYTENGYREITDSALTQKTELIKNTDRFKPMGFCQSGVKMSVLDGNFFMIVDSRKNDKYITVFNEFEYKEDQNQVYNTILEVMREVYKIK